MLADIHERLAGVVIEQLPDRFHRASAEGMLFYLDPPYWGCETDYGAEVFSRADSCWPHGWRPRAANSC
jgi:DNA adenine methylase